MKIDLFAPLWMASAFICGWLGLVSWWVVALLILSHIKIEVKIR